MGYSRVNHLRTVLVIQEIVETYKKKGVSQKWVYDNIIDKPEYPVNITYATFRRYMCINAKLELTKINEHEEN